MRKTCLLALLALVANGAFGQADKAEKPLRPLPRALEIELALSALPPHLRDGATVYVLNPARGFEVARKGTNGFHAFVARTGDDAFRGNWPLTAYRDDILYPVSFDAAGAGSNMRVFFDAAEAQAQGTPPAVLKRTIQARFRAGTYGAPERAGISYMLSPILRTYVDPDRSGDVETMSDPHVIYYAPGVKQHDTMIQPVGGQETAAITREHSDMLAQLCDIRAEWCLSEQTLTRYAYLQEQTLPVRNTRASIPFRSPL